ncbi:MAG: GDP-mannose 4,6-dehydratase [Bdellovibrionales bacterium]|nr:GDP-mannose 4,6-dehydratase [Bdellovibrionales bacterium]
MRALVTGVCGFVGKYLADYLVEYGDTVVGTYLQAEPQNVTWQSTYLDISDFKSCYSLIKQFKPDVVYHLAGISFVPEAEENFTNALVINVGGVNNIARSCHLLENNAKILIISSAEVYGRIKPEFLPLSETTPINPANNYSLSKRMAELIAPRYEQFNTISSVTLRPFNHIGPGQNNRFVASSFAYQLALIANGKEAPVIKVGNLEALRDFSDVRDIIIAYRLAAEKGHGIYNLGSGIATPIQYLLDHLIKISGLKVRIEKDMERMRPSEVPEIRADCSKALRDLGWKTQRSLEQSLADIYKFWFDNLKT